MSVDNERPARDLRAMSALDLLAYLTGDARKLSAHTLATFTRNGLYDLNWMEQNTALQFEIDNVPEELRNPEGLAMVAVVGAEAAANDPERLADWVKVVEAMVAADGLMEPTKAVRDLQSAGRTPAEALDLVAAYAEARDSGPEIVSLDMFGYEPDITGDTFRGLVQSPLAADYCAENTLSRYRLLGFSPLQAADLVRRGLSPEHVQYAQDRDVPAGEWDGLRRFRGDWIHRTDLSPEELDELRAAGWRDSLDERPGYRDDVDLLARLARNGIQDLVEVRRWNEALRLTPLTVPPPRDRLENYAAMAAAGVRRSDIAEYRLCGARTTEDFILIARKGLSMAQCTALRRRFGHPQGRSRVLVFASLQRFEEALRRDGLQE